MKWFFALFVVVAVILAVYPFIGEQQDTHQVTGLPWQIEIQPDGMTEVFGIHIGQSTVADVIEKLGDDMELAIVTSKGEDYSLEMYYGHYRAGLLSGKMVLQVDTPQSDLAAWRDNASSVDYMSTGTAKKFYLAKNDYLHALQARVIGITFIPAVNLDREVVEARFGKAENLVVKDGTTHFLYPEKGLHVAIDDDAKDVLQYVNPDDFQRLSTPILNGQ